MLQRLIELCTSDTALGWLVLASDLAIALAYFAIPVTMAVVLRDRKDDIPYPWLWTLFVTFIVACGLTHLVHVWSALLGTQYLGAQAGISIFTALVSVGTAVAFAFILPQIRHLPSPSRQREQLERLVAERSREKDRLIREINHRIGNQLQILSSIVAIETRKAGGEEATEILGRLKSHLDGMAKEHVERSVQDYLGEGSDGVIAAPSGTAAANDAKAASA
jgi:hypothetical protein